MSENAVCFLKLRPVPADPVEVLKRSPSTEEVVPPDMLHELVEDQAGRMRVLCQGPVDRFQHDVRMKAGQADMRDGGQLTGPVNERKVGDGALCIEQRSDRIALIVELVEGLEIVRLAGAFADCERRADGQQDSRQPAPQRRQWPEEKPGS